jgi:DNA-binding CsgD family transcriptional regulator
LVGRADELSGLLAFCASDAGGSVMVAGEAGIGKSRLLEEVGERTAAAGAIVLRGHAVPGSGPFRAVAEALVRAAPPSMATEERLRPFSAVLARLLPGWPAAAEHAGPRLVDVVVELGEAVLELLRVIAGGRRLVLLLDDLHWADRDTLVLLEYLEGGLVDLPVHVVLAARDDEQAPAELEALRRRVRRVQLVRLDDEQVAALARRCAEVPVSADVVAFLVAAAGGLPLLVEELFVGLVQARRIQLDRLGWHSAGRLRVTVPGAFAAVVEHRLAVLSERARALVRVAALLGGDLDGDLLAVVAGSDADEVSADLRAAVGAGLLVAGRGQGGALVWRHALVREAVLDGLASPQRAAMSRRAAEALLRDGQGLSGGRLALTASLCIRAGLPDRAVELLLRQGREQVAAGALHAAEDSFGKAAGLVTAGSQLAGAVAVERVRVLALSARTDEALVVGDAALPGLDDPARQDLARQLARACVAAERWDAAQAYLDVAAPDDGPEHLALAAHVALGRHERDAALRLAGAAVDAGERAGRPETVCEALEIIGRALRRSDPPASRAAFASGERLAVQHGLVPWRIRALAELGTHDMLGNREVGRLREARRLAAETGMLGTAVVLDLQIGAGTSGVEGYVAMLPFFRRCAELSERLRLPDPRAHALIFVGRGLFWSDEDELRAEPDEVARISPIHGVSSQIANRGYAAWLDHDGVGAVTLLGQGVAHLRASAVSNPVPLWGHWALLATVVHPEDTGPADELRHSDVLVQSANQAALHYADAVTATRAGRLDEARALLAAGDAAVAGWHHERLFLRCLMVTADGPAAAFAVEPLLLEALARWEPAGEVRLARWCREQLRALGLPVPRPGRDRLVVPARLRAVGVTSRELEVLRLVGAGASNAEVAARLHLSPRTVETHVGSLLAKTGASGRGALAHWLSP